MVDITVKVGGRQRLDRLIRRLVAAAGGGLQERLGAGVVDESPAALEAVRSAWAGVDVSSSKGGGSSSGLRARAAAATDFAPTGKGVRFEVDGPAVDSRYGRSLAWYLNGVGRWRHPTYGRSPWQQQSGEVVFAPTLLQQEPRYRARLERVMDEIAREIEG